jgi:hypothetical protein
MTQATDQFRQLITVTQDLTFAEVASAVHPGDIEARIDGQASPHIAVLAPTRP